jgi:hypothetical protein
MPKPNQIKPNENKTSKSLCKKPKRLHSLKTLGSVPRQSRAGGLKM